MVRYIASFLDWLERLARRIRRARDRRFLGIGRAPDTRNDFRDYFGADKADRERTSTRF